MNKLPIALLLGLSLTVATALTGCGDKECADNEYQSEDGTCNPMSSEAEYTGSAGETTPTDDTGSDTAG